MDISFSPLLIIDFLFPHEIVLIKKDRISISSLFENLYGIDIGSNSMKDFLLYSKNLKSKRSFISLLIPFTIFHCVAFI